jgi:hypothetical protein
MNEPRTITFRVCGVARQRNVTRVRFASPSIGSTSGVPDCATRCQNDSVLLSPAAICRRSQGVYEAAHLTRRPSDCCLIQRILIEYICNGSFQTPLKTVGK